MGSELQRRTVTGVLLVLIVGGALILGDFWFWLASLILSSLFYREYALMYKKKRSHSFYFSTGLIGIGYYLGIYYEVPYALHISLLLLLFYGAFRVITRFPDFTYKNIRTTIFGFLYCYMFFSSIFLLRREAEGLQWIIFILLVSILGDVGAYLVGRKLGKSKIAPILSPGKSLEGLLGGLFIGSLGGLAYAFTVLSLSVPVAILLSIAIIFIGLMGDLFESHLKRELKLKDSGNGLPGHGGFLDRFDAIIFLSGFIYILLSAGL